MTIDLHQNTQLSRLQPVDLRTIWQNEASNFTPWLAQEENLALLGDTIGLELELEAVEKFVGPFRADIVCKDTLTDAWVLIENQLESTDHNHLGQLLTYAAGLNAVTIVWIARRFTDEHRAALDWLNEVTSEDINLFGLEIELWRIADSPAAPKFNIISKPNDWTQTVNTSRRLAAEDLTPTRALQLEYWQAFANRLSQTGSIIRARKPRPRHWMNFAVGRSGFRLGTFANTRDKRIGVQLIIHKGDIEAYYHLLFEDKDEIERELGTPLQWRELPHRKQSHITLHNRQLDPNNRTNWPQQHAWLQENLEAFYNVFSPRIKTLHADDYDPEPEEDTQEAP